MRWQKSSLGKEADRTKLSSGARLLLAIMDEIDPDGGIEMKNLKEIAVDLIMMADGDVDEALRRFEAAQAAGVRMLQSKAG